MSQGGPDDSLYCLRLPAESIIIILIGSNGERRQERETRDSRKLAVLQKPPRLLIFFIFQDFFSIFATV